MQREYYVKYRDAKSTEQRERDSSAARKRHREVGFVAQSAWEKRNPEKRAAMAAVMHALKTGRLVREPCLFCGDEQVEAHHHSYAQADRLNVTWLCRSHHRRAHRTV